MTVTFRLLGPLEVRYSGGLVRIAGTRQQRLLVLLLLEVNRVVQITALIDQLWVDPPPSARQQIYKAICGLRKALALRIDRVGSGYRLLLPAPAIDWYQFLRTLEEADRAAARGDLAEAADRLRTGLDLWRGNALAGLAGDAFTNAAVRLEEQRLVAVEKLMSLRIRLGDDSAVVGELRELVAVHPLREAFRLGLMQALHRSGRQAEALEVYDEGRRILADELGLDPGPDLRRYHQVILSGEGLEPAPAGRRVPDVAAEPAGPPDLRPVKSYLPHDVTDFSGRCAEITRLTAAVRDTDRLALTISSIDGMGGVGKTALAVHLGHKLAEDYPDGQYFVDLHGFSLGIDPVTPAQALDALLSDSGLPPELVPPTVQGRSSLWRSRMAGKKALLVLDNALNTAQVRPLLPGTSGVLVLITSRRKLTALEGAMPLSLDVLPDDDAIRLFTKVAGPERTEGQEQAVAVVVRICGNLPLAIRVAAARFRERTGWTVADLARRLLNQADRARLLRVEDRSVTAVLRLSYRYLSTAQRRVFRRLSLHPGVDFDAYVVAALVGCQPGEAEQCLEELADDNLVRSGGDGRYHLHDLVRDCAQLLLRENEDEAERRSALSRLFDYYLHSAHAWSEHLVNNLYRVAPDAGPHPAHIRRPPDVVAASKFLDAERANLVAVAQLAAENGWYRHAWQLACSLQPMLKLRNYGGHAHALFERGVDAARTAGDPDGESLCLQGLSAVCREQGSRAEAKEHLEHALKLSRDLGDQDAVIAQLVDLATLLLGEDRPTDARNVLRDAAALATGGHGAFLRGVIANNTGAILRDLGEFDEALEHLHAALAMTEPSELARSGLMTRWSVGTIHHLRGEPERALAEFTAILESSGHSGFEHGRALALLGLSAVRRSLGDIAESLDRGRAALTLARGLGLRTIECEALNCVGEAALAGGDPDCAEQIFEQAVGHAERYRLMRYKARGFDGLAHVALARGNRVDAARLWREAVNLYPEGMADAEFARAHLSRPDLGGVCFRCATKSSAGG
ncbi:AfsR/SARP family transcriptional regulator [Saccharothrix australiensis]|uniref:DNA-binding SARP family transcriptional activator n=1 Tax=Saccharothrix australiensis TaxID=2072 RepID=A0A495W0L6_9PSEU|nr:BTAD domain-containing putative transcriptional regulator [Saccharothrix australiensis]RKT54235.1 DNA-binding SARP family transcriptional activator [Saccharothrix australiensis]